MDHLRKIILDVDTGSDDAIAIMTAILSGRLDVLAVTTCFGNVPLPHTTDNTLHVIDHIGARVPVYAGCAHPLVRDLLPGRAVNAEEIPKETIVDGKVVAVHDKVLPLPDPVSRAQEENAVVWLLRTLKNTKEKITLIPVGPLTNIATVLRLDPSVKENIDEIILMGGGVNIHNRAYRSETNFFNDPEAAKIVLKSGVKTTLVTLDATHSVWFGYDDADKLESVGTKAAAFAAQMLRHRIYAANMTGARKEPYSALHDVLAVCAAIDPTVLTDVRHETCDVEISGGLADGMLLTSMRYRYSQPALPTYVAYQADKEKFFAMMCEALSHAH